MFNYKEARKFVKENISLLLNIVLMIELLLENMNWCKRINLRK